MQKGSRVLVFAAACVVALGASAGWWYYERSLSPDARHRSIVRTFLTDPDSAVFRDTSPAKRGGNVWCGALNARNRMGGMVGFTRYVLQLPDEDYGDPELMLALSQFVTDDGGEGFANKWRLMCEGR